MITPAQALARVRKICLGFPDTSERASHGSPTFFIKGKKSFVSFLNNHHGDGRLAIWCMAPPGAQAMLVEAAPARYFVPPYVGHLGWVGVHLDKGTPWPEIAGVIENAYRARAGR